MKLFTNITISKRNNANMESEMFEVTISGLKEKFNGAFTFDTLDDAALKVSRNLYNNDPETVSAWTQESINDGDECAVFWCDFGPGYATVKEVK